MRAQAAAPETSTQVARGAETVLVAEDDAGVRRLTERVLGPLGYRVLCAATAEEALEIGGAHPGADRPPPDRRRHAGHGRR